MIKATSILFLVIFCITCFAATDVTYDTEAFLSDIAMVGNSVQGTSGSEEDLLVSMDLPKNKLSWNAYAKNKNKESSTVKPTGTLSSSAAPTKKSTVAPSLKSQIISTSPTPTTKKPTISPTSTVPTSVSPLEIEKSTEKPHTSSTSSPTAPSEIPTKTPSHTPLLPSQLPPISTPTSTVSIPPETSDKGIDPHHRSEAQQRKAHFAQTQVLRFRAAPGFGHGSTDMFYVDRNEHGKANLSPNTVYLANGNFSTKHGSLISSKYFQLNDFFGNHKFNAKFLYTSQNHGNFSANTVSLIGGDFQSFGSIVTNKFIALNAFDGYGKGTAKLWYCKTSRTDTPFFSSNTVYLGGSVDFRTNKGNIISNGNVVANKDLIVNGFIKNHHLNERLINLEMDNKLLKKHNLILKTRLDELERMVTSFHGDTSNKMNNNDPEIDDEESKNKNNEPESNII